MRLFIAINLPLDVRKRLWLAARTLRESELPVRWLGPESLHMTLKFLGEVSPDRVARMEASLAVVAGKTRGFEVDLGGFGAFPSLRKPRIIWAGAYASPELRCLKHDLEWEFAALGFEREARAFHPHLTLGRARADARAGDFRRLEEIVGSVSFEATARVSQIDLMRSHLSSGGSRYEVLRPFSLGETPVRMSVRGS